jgi:uncharacterized protein YjbJ (UPF0337 family)
MNMNKDILKGKKLEITGRVKQTWGMLTGNDLEEIEGKREKLLGRLQKTYGRIEDKAELEYQDSIEFAEIVSRIREIMNIKNDATAIAFIARYGKPLLAKNQERQITEKKNQRGYDTDRYFDSRLSRRNTHPAI